MVGLYTRLVFGSACTWATFRTDLVQVKSQAQNACVRISTFLPSKQFYIRSGSNPISALWPNQARLFASKPPVYLCPS